VYADGSVVWCNPSPYGLAYGWVWVAADDATAVDAGAGVYDPAAVGLETVENNLGEVVALVHALEGLPAGWAGRVRTDSLNAIRAWAGADRRKYIPPAWWDRLVAARDRLGPLGWELLGGHPTKAELAAGVLKDGKPVSRWNVWCDTAATAAGRPLRPGAEAVAATEPQPAREVRVRRPTRDS
jgi:ribonuclease HI